MAGTQWRTGTGAAVLIAVLLCGACSSSSNSPSTPTTSQATAQFCSDYTALKGSLQDLATINVVSVGTNGLTAAVDDIKTNAAALGKSAGVFAPQVNALNTAIGQLQSTIHGLSSNGLRNALPTIGRQIAAVGAAGQDLAAAVRTACPSASSS